jgi:small subunit ribosomal protein S21
MMMNRNEPNTRGVFVIVKNDDVNRALKKLKNKVEEAGTLKDLQEKEFYTKPTEKRRRAKAAGRQRYLKKIEREQLPKKLY